ncbi:Bpu10I family restriction endonuclease [Streptomyces thinghirensis]|nr:Bpu10I family restriction endonuclease [Streptomyces thinghirensis]
MFQEASATSHDLKVAVPAARYYLICEYLDMTPISTAGTDIDEVLILRGKRLGSHKRKAYSSATNRKRLRSEYVDYIEANPIRYDVVQRFVDHLKSLFEAKNRTKKMSSPRDISRKQENGRRGDLDVGRRRELTAASSGRLTSTCSCGSGAVRSPWRGQFTPGLVSKLPRRLLSRFRNGKSIPSWAVARPSWSAFEKVIPSAGVEINPAALELSGILEIASLPHDQRLRIVQEASSYLDKVADAGQDTLFGSSAGIEDVVEYLLDGHRGAVRQEHRAHLFHHPPAEAWGTRRAGDAKKVQKSWNQVRDLIMDFPSASVPSQVIAGDARRVLLGDGCAGLVVTSLRTSTCSTTTRTIVLRWKTSAGMSCLLPEPKSGPTVRIARTDS